MPMPRYLPRPPAASILRCQGHPSPSSCPPIPDNLSGLGLARGLRSGPPRLKSALTNCPSGMPYQVTRKIGSMVVEAVSRPPAASITRCPGPPMAVFRSSASLPIPAKLSGLAASQGSSCPVAVAYPATYTGVRGDQVTADVTTMERK